MVSNRRNYYRLLQVQPDATAEVIKAAYRALMVLHHPDKGGDHMTAVLINEAFGVLSDPARRAHYDAQRAARSGRQTLKDMRADSTDQAPAASNPFQRSCPMCEQPVPPVVRHGARCARCSAPLEVVPHGSVPPNKANDRRGIPRVTKSDWGKLYLDWESEPIDVRMRDLSLDGISVYSGLAAAARTRIRVVSDAFDIVAEVVSCRRLNNVFTLHARLVTALFTSSKGGFVSTKA